MTKQKQQQKTKNQHYVPQFYLRHFCDDKERFFAFDKPKQKILPSTPENVAASQYFYDFSPTLQKDGTDPQLIEHALQRAESIYSVSMSTILDHLNDNGTFPDSERSTFADFIAVQFFRTLDIRTVIQQSQILTDVALKGEKGGPYESFDDPESLSVIQAMLMTGAAPEAAEMLLKHIWIVGRNTTSDSLYTSDSPIIRVPHVHDELMGTAGLSSPGIEVCLPLSPKYILFMIDRNFHNLNAHQHLQAIDLVPADIKFYNQRQVYSSHRQVFSITNDFEIAREVLAVRTDVGNPKRQRMRFIWGGKEIRVEDATG